MNSVQMNKYKYIYIYTLPNFSAVCVCVGGEVFFKLEKQIGKRTQVKTLEVNSLYFLIYSLEQCETVGHEVWWGGGG